MAVRRQHPCRGAPPPPHRLLPPCIQQRLFAPWAPGARTIHPQPAETRIPYRARPLRPRGPHPCPSPRHFSCVPCLSCPRPRLIRSSLALPLATQHRTPPRSVLPSMSRSQRMHTGSPARPGHTPPATTPLFSCSCSPPTALPPCAPSMAPLDGGAGSRAARLPRSSCCTPQDCCFLCLCLLKEPLVYTPLPRCNK